MIEHPRKRLGHCTICDVPVFKFAANGALGAPLDCAARAKIVMIDGSTGDVTFCRACLESVSMSDLHAILIEAWWLEMDDDYRVSCGGQPLTPDQRTKLTAALDAQRTNVPLGVLHSESWADALEREARRAVRP